MVIPYWALLVMSFRDGPLSGDLWRASNRVNHARVFDAPTEQGFRLFTDPTELAKWWGPAWVHNARDPDRLRVGGSLRFTMQPPKGEAFPLSGEFLEIQPPSKIRFTFR